jgi:acetate---CoA ligase (ADP-forming) subunit alpha
MDNKPANMHALFNPRSVAVIGASDNPGKLGFHVMRSLSEGGYRGKLLPMNPRSEQVMGFKCYAGLDAYDGDIDLAIIVVPANTVPRVFRECAEKGVKGIVLITAGFREIEDPAGTALQAEITAIADGAGIPVMGPNTFGMINFHRDLNASFTPEFSRLKRGPVALVSQSGGMSHLIGFLGMRLDVGFSKIVGLGNRLNVGFSEMIAYLNDDPDTKAIALYIEGIDEPRRLMDAAKRYAGGKPTVVYKTGSAHAGNQASLSHTGTLAGRHEIYLGGLRQAGLLTVPGAEQLLDTAKALAGCPLPKGPGVAVLSGQAGPGMAGCDVCEAEGLKVVRFRERTQAAVNELLPPLALRTNPVDMGPAWYDSTAITGIVRAVLEDDNVDAVLLFMMFASANVDAVERMSGLLKGWAQKKPLISCILSPPGIWDDRVKDLEDAGALINFPTPERAAKTLSDLWKCARMKTIQNHETEC